MHQRHRIGLECVEHGGAPRHAAGVPVFELTAGDQHHRVVGIGSFVGRDDVGRHEARPAAFAREVFGEDDRVARVAINAARVGNSVFAVESLPSDAGNADRKSVV